MTGNTNPAGNPQIGPLRRGPWTVRDWWQRRKMDSGLNPDGQHGKDQPC